jgi:hypothetical protein
MLLCGGALTGAGRDDAYGPSSAPLVWLPVIAGWMLDHLINIPIRR